MPNPEKPAPELAISLDPREVVALDAEDRYRQAFEAMRKALKLCHANLLHRADSRSKWTQGDQNAFDKALSALRLAEEVKRGR